MTTAAAIKAMFIDDVEARRKAIIDFVKDEANPFEERLDVWSNTPEHLQTRSGYIMSLDEFEAKYGEISWYDDFHAERYTEVDLTEIVKEQGESGRIFRQNRKDWDSPLDKEKFELFVKSCVNSGYHGFTYDW